MSEITVMTTEYGNPDGPVVVLGPSLGTSSILWDPVRPLLGDHYRLLSWDLPGHGLSPRATGKFSLAELGAAVIAELDRIGVDNFHYAGVSLGGAVGLELALRYPERMLSATILGSAARIGTPEGWRERAESVRALGTASLVVGSAQRWFAPGAIERLPELSGRLLHTLRDADRESYALACLALAEYDVRDSLGDIHVPLLAIAGADDAVTPPEDARFLAESVPGASWMVLPETAHLIAAERPEAVAAAMRNLMENHK